ncbi:MAG TPA: right-handed parallel beta-helix repeat-containing protein, partial [Candidatus Cloacimonetes bacterium]|nr:right-handed parallel beta-helix repeat-containing protein [Candidatus Cloacimonadota bacterium]
PVFSSCNITNNGSYGVYCVNTTGVTYAPYPSFSDCNISDNGSYPLYLYADNAKDISTPMTFTGNAYNKIYLQADDINTGTWTNFGIPYVVGGNMEIPDGETLTIEAGNTLKFAGNYIFTVNGTLLADGDAANHITFTSNQSVPTPGFWKFIHFYAPDNPCILDYCDISYAGAVHSGSSRGNILLQWCGSYVNFTNCTISHSLSNGVKVREYSNPAFTSCDITYNGTYGVYSVSSGYPPYPSFSNCNVMNNGSYPLYLLADNAKDISAPMAFSGNDPNAVFLQADDVNTGTWNNLGVPYVIGGNLTIPDGETLTIEAGNTMKFASNYTFTVNGTLIADGDAANHITFTSNQPSPSPGDWKSIYVYGPDAPCVFDYCDVSYGGALWGSTHYGSIFLDLAGGYFNPTNCTIENGASNGVYLYRSCSPAITSTTIQNNAESGIYCTNGGAYPSTPSLTNSSVINNSGYGIYLEGSSSAIFGTNLSEWNDIYGNASYEFYNNTTNDITAEYIYWGSVDYAYINNSIYDQNDNGSLGLVDYTPWTNAAHDTEYPIFLDSPVVTITIVSGNVNLDWDDVPLATSYKVYSDTDPYGDFNALEYDGTDTSWSESADMKKFYYVTAVN